MADRCPPAWQHGSVLASLETVQLPGKGPYRFHLKVADVGVVAAWAGLLEAVAVQLCQLAVGGACPQVQPIHVLTHHVLDLAQAQQGQYYLLTGSLAGILLQQATV